MNFVNIHAIHKYVKFPHRRKKFIKKFCEILFSVFSNKRCEAKGIGDPGPFHIKPIAHAEEEEMSKDEQRKSKPSGCDAEDDPVLGRPRSRKGEVSRHQGESPRASQWKARAPWVGHRGIAEKRSQERPSPPH